MKGRLLAHLRGEHPEGGLSLYMAAGPGFDPGYYRGLLKGVERDLKGRLDASQHLRLEVEMLSAHRLIDDVRPPGMPLAIFSCEPDGVLDARRLAEDVPTGGWFGTRFHTEPLDDQLERHPPGLVAVVEKDSARIFQVVLQDVRERDRFEGERVRASRRQGPNSSRHHVQNEERLNIKQAVDRLMRVRHSRPGLEALYVGGPVAARSRFLDQLPAPLRGSVRGELDIQVGIRPSELADQLRHLI